MAPLRLTPAQVFFYETFGFLHLPALFAREVDALIAAFEDVFRSHEPTCTLTRDDDFLQQTRGPRVESKRILLAPDFVDRDPRLAALRSDPRVTGVVESLLGPNHEYFASDANLFYTDTSWHPDTYMTPLERRHVKLSFYLDPVSGHSGAIRIIPGSHLHQGPFAIRLRETLHRPPSEIEARYGVPAQEIPSWTLPSEPGDVLVWNLRAVHASFGGADRRRSFSMIYRETAASGAGGRNTP